MLSQRYWGRQLSCSVVACLLLLTNAEIFMTDIDAIHSWEHWSDFLFRLGAISTPADLQGFVTGLLASGGAIDVDKWQDLAQEFMDLPEPLTELEQKEAINAYFYWPSAPLQTLIMVTSFCCQTTLWLWLLGLKP